MSQVPKMSLFGEKSKKAIDEKSKNATSNSASSKQDLKFCYFNKILVTEDWYRIVKYIDSLLKTGIHSETIKYLVELDKLYSEKARLEELAEIRRSSGADWHDLAPINKQTQGIDEDINNSRFNINNSLARTGYFKNFSYFIHSISNRYGLHQLPELSELYGGMSEPFAQFASDIEEIVNCWKKYIAENNWFNKYTVIYGWVYDEGVEITEQDYRDVCRLIDGLSSYINSEKMYLIGSDDKEFTSTFSDSDEDVALLDVIVENIDKMQEFLRSNAECIFSLAEKFNMMVETDGFILLSYLEFLRDKYKSKEASVPLLKYVFEDKLVYKPERDYFYEELKDDFGDGLFDLNALDL